MQAAVEGVKEFTEGSMGSPVPAHPRPMSVGEVRFITTMVLDELLEIMSTVYDDPDETHKQLAGIVESMQPRYDLKKSDNPLETVTDQADAMVDWIYYTLNAAAKAGINLGPSLTRFRKLIWTNATQRQESLSVIRVGKCLSPRAGKQKILRP